MPVAFWVVSNATLYVPMLREPMPAAVTRTPVHARVFPRLERRSASAPWIRGYGSRLSAAIRFRRVGKLLAAHRADSGYPGRAVEHSLVMLKTTLRPDTGWEWNWWVSME
jgi:hypothetical protein